MDWLTLLSALGLFLVFEGILPFMSPLRYRTLMQTMGLQSEVFLRVIGFISMLMGLFLVSFAHYLFN